MPARLDLVELRHHVCIAEREVGSRRRWRSTRFAGICPATQFSRELRRGWSSGYLTIVNLRDRGADRNPAVLMAVMVSV